MPKAGWVLSIERAPLAEPYDSHGRKVSDDVVRITWKAASKEAFLADAYYDEFVLRGQAPAKAGLAWFQVRQLCEKGEWNWADTPTSGTSTAGALSPLGLVDVVKDHTAP